MRQLRWSLRSETENLRFSSRRHRLLPSSSQQYHPLQSSSSPLHLHRLSSRKSWHPPTLSLTHFMMISVQIQIDFSPEELDSAMQEMEEEYSRDEQANNAVTSRGVLFTIGTAMDEDQPGQAPPTSLEKGKGPLIAADDDRAKVMPPPPNPVQQPQEL